VGTLPDRTLAVALARWLRPDPDVFAPRPKTVTVTSARGSEGERVRFVSNWSWEQTALAMPVAATDVISGEPIASGETLHLGPWDVRVLLERPPEKEGEEGRPLA
jgi:beta-galactosidase